MDKKAINYIKTEFNFTLPVLTVPGTMGWQLGRGGGGEGLIVGRRFLFHNIHRRFLRGFFTFLSFWFH